MAAFRHGRNACEVVIKFRKPWEKKVRRRFVGECYSLELNSGWTDQGGCAAAPRRTGQSWGLAGQAARGNPIGLAAMPDWDSRLPVVFTMDHGG